MDPTLSSHEAAIRELPHEMPRSASATMIQRRICEHAIGGFIARKTWKTEKAYAPSALEVGVAILTP